MDVLAARKRVATVPVLVYRSSTAGLSYAEALWYVHYLTLHPEVRPDALVVQLNYQSFWNGGVREGMQTMLEDARFRKEIEAEAAGSRPYAETFAEAVRSWQERQGRQTSASSQPETPPGARWDDWVREKLDAWPEFARRADQKISFAELMYRLRVYLLRLTPATARTISGTRWDRNCAAIEAVAKLCRDRGVRLVLFNAPVNPQVNLYRTPQDRETYQNFLRSLEAAYGVRVHDLENAIPREDWGMWLTMPDPLHLGRAGHVRMADRIAAVLEEELTARRAGR